MQTKEELIQELFNQSRKALIPCLHVILDKAFENKDLIYLPELSGTVLGKIMAWTHAYFNLIAAERLLECENVSDSTKQELIQFIKNQKEQLALYEDLKMNDMKILEKELHSFISQEFEKANAIEQSKSEKKH